MAGPGRSPPRDTAAPASPPHPAALPCSLNNPDLRAAPRFGSDKSRRGEKKGPVASKGAALMAARSGAEQSRGRVRHGRARGLAARGGGLAGTRAGLWRVALKKEGGELAQCSVTVRDRVLHRLGQFGVAGGERKRKSRQQRHYGMRPPPVPKSCPPDRRPLIACSRASVATHWQSQRPPPRPGGSP